MKKTCLPRDSLTDCYLCFTEWTPTKTTTSYCHIQRFKKGWIVNRTYWIVHCRTEMHYWLCNKRVKNINILNKSFGFPYRAVTLFCWVCIQFLSYIIHFSTYINCAFNYYIKRIMCFGFWMHYSVFSDHCHMIAYEDLVSCCRPCDQTNIIRCPYIKLPVEQHSTFIV